MLTSLYIQNIAVISKATIRFEEGLNVFTGETGAGKTMLISAIDAVLGERVSRDIIRTGEEKAVVSALFEEIPPRVLQALAELGFEEDDGGFLITREVSATGKSTGKINGMPATAGVLKQVASLLIHIHGQRDSSQILSPEHHIRFLDDYGAHTALIDEYRAEYEQMKELARQIQALQMDEQQKAQRIDLLTYQIEEIEEANLADPGEEKELLAQRKLITSSEKVLEALAAAYAELAGDDDALGINTMFSDLTECITAAAEYLPAMEASAERLSEMGYELQELTSDLRDQLDNFDFNPRELDEIERRLDLIYRLKQKYGADISEILSYLEGIQAELEEITSSAERLENLTAQHQQSVEKAEALAEKLTRRRAIAAKAFMKGVETELAFLDMPSVKLSVKRAQKPLAPDGWDEIAFYVSTNVGEEPKPLNKIASGGEVSRMMLAIKNVMAERDDIGTLIFDEVDIGVSGRAAQKIGRKLAQVSEGRQVICVTHLAQVAAFADKHLLIYKEVEGGRTHTRVEELDPSRRAAELARITSGDNITEIALENARELLAGAQEARGG